MDDLTLLEIVSLTNMFLLVPNNHLKSQDYLDTIADWTTQKKMVLNEKKSKSLISLRNYNLPQV